MRRQLRLILRVVPTAAFLVSSPTAWAAIPEPGVIYFGTVAVDGQVQGSSSGTTVSVTRGGGSGGEKLACYYQGDSPPPEAEDCETPDQIPSVGDLYVLRIRLEADQGGPQSEGTAQITEAG